MWNNPIYRNSQLKALAESNSTKEFSKKISKINIIRTSCPKYRKQMSIAMNKVYAERPEVKDKISSSIKSMWKTEEYRNKLINNPGKTKGTMMSWKNPDIRKARLDSRKKSYRSVEPWNSIEQVYNLWLEMNCPPPSAYVRFRENAKSLGLPDVSYNAILKSFKNRDFSFTKLEGKI